MFEIAELGQKLDRATFEMRLPGVRERLLDAQFTKSADSSLIILIGGVEGAGKGETVNLLLEWLDSRGIATHALGKPNREERERPEHYRFCAGYHQGKHRHFFWQHSPHRGLRTKADGPSHLRS